MLSACEGSSRRVGIYNFVGGKASARGKNDIFAGRWVPKNSQGKHLSVSLLYQNIDEGMLFPKCVGDTGEGKINEFGEKE